MPFKRVRNVTRNEIGPILIRVVAHYMQVDRRASRYLRLSVEQTPASLWIVLDNTPAQYCLNHITSREPLFEAVGQAVLGDRETSVPYQFLEEFFVCHALHHLASDGVYH